MIGCGINAIVISQSWDIDFADCLSMLPIMIVLALSVLGIVVLKRRGNVYFSGKVFELSESNVISVAASRKLRRMDVKV
jgi:hypothetical protein